MTKDWVHSRKPFSWENKYSFNIIFQRCTFRIFNIKLADCLSSGLMRSLDQKVSFLSCGFCFIACGCMESVLLAVLPNIDLCNQACKAPLKLQDSFCSLLCRMGWLMLPNFACIPLHLPSWWWSYTDLLQLGICPVSSCGKMLISIQMEYRGVVACERTQMELPPWGMGLITGTRKIDVEDCTRLLVWDVWKRNQRQEEVI